MKYINIPMVTQANALLSRLSAAVPKQGMEIEVYSCKQTKLQKQHRSIKKPLRYYISALEQAFPDYDLSRLTLANFANTDYALIQREISYVLFTVHKNIEDVNEMLLFMDRMMQGCVGVKNLQCYHVDRIFDTDTEKFRVYLMYDRAQKRIMLVKLSNKV